jgi:uroporphyrinogen decarboxylase
MFFSSRRFIDDLLASPRRLAIPIMAATTMRRLGITARLGYCSGLLQAHCLKAVSDDGRADACIALMDLSIEAEAFGAPTDFVDDDAPPCVTAPIVHSSEDVAALAVPKLRGTRVAEALEALRYSASGIDQPLFGSMIGPFSLAGRLAGLSEIMMMAATEARSARQLLAKSSAFLLKYAQAIKDRGVDGLIIAEPAAGLLSPDMCQEFSADFLQDIIRRVKDDSFMVIVHNCGRTEKQVEAMLSTGCDALHVGNAVNMLDILSQLPRDFPVMGNIDPVVILKDASAEAVYAHCRDFLLATADYPNLVLSSGCDMPMDTPAANIDAFFRARDEFRRNSTPA